MLTISPGWPRMPTSRVTRFVWGSMRTSPPGGSAFGASLPVGGSPRAPRRGRARRLRARPRAVAARGVRWDAARARPQRLADLLEALVGHLGLPRASTASIAGGRSARSLGFGTGSCRCAKIVATSSVQVGHAAGEALEDQAGEPVLVGAAINLLATDLLRGDVRDRAHELAVGRARSVALWVSQKSAR